MLPHHKANINTQVVEIESEIENFLDNFRKNYEEWETGGYHSAQTIEQVVSSDSGTSLCTVTSLSSLSSEREGDTNSSSSSQISSAVGSIASSTSHLPASDSASSSLSMRSHVSSSSAGCESSGELIHQPGSPSLGKFRQFYKSAYLALSKTPDLDYSKSCFTNLTTFLNPNDTIDTGHLVSLIIVWGIIPKNTPKVELEYARGLHFVK